MSLGRCKCLFLLCHLSPPFKISENNLDENKYPSNSMKKCIVFNIK